MAKQIKLCKEHIDGFTMIKLFGGGSVLYYHGTPINKLTVIETDQEHCVQCRLDKKVREIRRRKLNKLNIKER